MTQNSPSLTRGRIALEWFNAFSDGVLAIVITILVLTIEVPDDYDFGKRGVGPFLVMLEKQLRPYLASFLLVATYWIQHAAVCRHARYATRAFARLDVLFLLPVTLVPFVVDLHNSYPGEKFVIAIFGGTHIACFGTLLLLWQYVIAHCREGAPQIGERERRGMISRLIAAMVLAALSVVVSFWNERAGAIVFMSIPLIFLSHRLADAGPDAAPSGD